MNKVIINRNGLLLEATNHEPITGFVERTFFVRRLVDKINKYGQRVGMEQGPPEPQYRHQGERLIMPVGLWYRLKTMMNETKIPYEYHDLRNKEWPKPDFKNISRQGYKLRPGQPELLAKMVTADIGRISNPTGDGKTFLICMFVLLYPKAKILIVTEGLTPFNALFRRLVEVHPNIGRVGGGKHDLRKITLCNRDSLHKAPLEEFDWILVDECHTMATSNAAPKFSKGNTDAKIFGFSATPTGRHDGSDMLSEVMFGPIIHEVPYQVSRARGNVSQINVLMFDVPKGPLVGGYQNDITRKRHAYWRNVYRNKCIAYVAKEIIPADEQQLIIVDTIEHALRIRKLLPEWAAAYRPPQSKKDEKMLKFVVEGLIKEEAILTKKMLEELELQFEKGGVLKAIANSVWHKAVDFTKLEWLIRADGGRGKIGNLQIAGRLSRLHDDNVKQLVDFYDSFDDIPRGRSEARLREYKKQGWTIERRALPAMG